MTQLVTPYLYYEDGEAAIEFLTRAFGFREVDRATGSAGGLHAELDVSEAGGRIYLGQPTGDFQNPADVGSTCQLYVIVDAVDEHYARAAAEGAVILCEPKDLAYGQRRYECVD